MDKIRSRSWLATVNNYTDDDCQRARALADKADYAVSCFEVGEQGTPHFHAYYYFASARTGLSVKKSLPRAHLDKCQGTAKHSRDYILHEGEHENKDCEFKPWFECGVMPTQGKRKSFDEIREAIGQGKKIRDIVPIADSLQSIKAAEVLLRYMEVKRSWVPEVRWYWGPSGFGKTRSAREWLGEDDIYECLDNIRWWDGYDAHQNVLIDDFRKTWCSFEYLLRLLDRYPMKVEIKGGTRQFLARKIAITTTKSPEVVYEDSDEELAQLTRRITEIIFIG